MTRLQTKIIETMQTSISSDMSNKAENEITGLEQNILRAA